MTAADYQENLFIGQAHVASTNDRLGFGLFVALALHAILILGVGFAQEELEKASTTIEITLAQHQSDVAPDEADYVAQFNQEGSGTLEEKKTLTTEKLSPFHDTKIREINPEQQLKELKKANPSDKNLIATTSKNQDLQTSIVEDEPKPEKDNREGKTKTQIERSQEIASMEARLDKQRQIDAKRPRIHRLTSVAAKASVDAAYLHNWRNRIEIVGNLYYPEKARQQQIYGKLILLVTILPDGKIFETKVIKSSGYKLLDDAAIQTVKRAAPFSAFPPELLAIADRLEIIRTWEFDRDNQMTAQ